MTGQVTGHKPSRIRVAHCVGSAVVVSALCVQAVRSSERTHEPDYSTIALWLFDEPDYRGMTLTDASRHQYDLRLRANAKLSPGRFGNALWLEPAAGIAAEFACPPAGLYRDPVFLESDFVPEAFNLGYLDWTLEFWFHPAGAPRERGIVFEVAGLPTPHVPAVVNSLSLEAGGAQFVLHSPEQSVTALPGAVDRAGGIVAAKNQTRRGLELAIPTDGNCLTGAKPGWHHVAFTFAARERQMRHYVDGRLQPLPAKGGFLPMKGRLKSLTIGRDQTGGQPLAGAIDEMRLSSIARYRDEFAPPASFSRNYGANPPAPAKPTGPTLLFAGDQSEQANRSARPDPPSAVVKLGSRKHVFLDDVLLDELQNLQLSMNPPRWEVTDFRIDQPWEPTPRFGPGMPDVLSVFDDDGEIRMAYTNGGMWGGKPDAICVATSRDGLHWEKPRLGLIPWDGSTANNIVLTDATQGTMFRDANPAVPADERYKYIAFHMQRGIYVYTSPDCSHWKRNETIALPFDCGGGAEAFWDDQRGAYCLFLRHEGAWTSAGGPGRACGLACTREPLKPWPFARSDQPGVRVGIFSLPSVTSELPIAIGPNRYGQVYRSTAVKYPGAPDAYVAFPWRYDGEANRRPGSELMVSRDGEHWRGYGDPFYLSSDFAIEGRQVIEALMHEGLVVRGEQVLQFATARFTAHGGAAYGGTEYEGGIHDRFLKLTQRLDGFVSLEAGESAGAATTHPLIFEGGRLEVNACAKGALRVGLADETGRSLDGFAVEDCDPFVGDSVHHVVTWRKQSKLDQFAGKIIRLKLELTDAKLYALQFSPH